MTRTSGRAPESLWQIGDLNARDDGSWVVSADRALGPALGTLVPVAATAEGEWRVAIRDRARVIRLTPVDVDRWTALGFEAGDEETQSYACLLRYDHPADRPGATFGVAVARELDIGDLKFMDHEAPTGCAGVGEVDQVLDLLSDLHGPELARKFIDGPVSAPQATASASTPASTQAEQDEVSFVFVSCQYPAGMMDRLDANRSFEMLDAWLSGAKRLPQAILLVGDQVYTDATYGLLDPARLDDRYRLPYEELAGADGPMSRLSTRFRPLLRRMLDDHEILDNWEPWSARATGERYRRGLEAYWYYQRCEESPRQPVWMQLPANPATAAGWRVFMADSRSSREFRSETTLHSASLLGEPQTRALEAWLTREPASDLKIVTTAAMLLPRVRIDADEPLRLDNWQGYPASFHRMLAFVCDHGIRNLVFLAGDAHLGCSAEITVRNEDSGAWASFGSHHAPALYAPYPFANETMWNLMLEDRFRFRWQDPDGKPSNYLCCVSARVTGDDRTGFGLLQARRTQGEWRVDVGFRINALGPAGPQEMRTPCSAAM
ncbi:alkaline phosphatase D family protein [Ramlibacter ginsenosidimutans]|uniref:Alkaline phosphatase D family protein n=1 Tax=Ramlibacter ginsenosidimutans TaxID=502333 RepID=A0A934U0K6_9BURK|nr:alkaline phosphatase D family protein [Ramlibacter ginsenosidimutans]MBK6009477.1 alkaline phosphatase D family protein [Ramlibacter ginsenosidimutans]